MSMKEFRNPATLHAPLATYTHQIEVSGPQRWLVLSGQVGMRPDGSLPQDAQDQFEIALANIGKNLEAAGMSVTDLVKLSFYLVDPLEPAFRRKALSAFMGDHAPCMTLIYVAALAPSLKVEIDA
jgi:enamine deaminase RidA (YjgF/YER057c/UK114 family)